ncbi:MAG: RagB/SusD family nutrient uptake outer membrane protein [Bacteroidales bacterium]|nr:RagB/SusD family nutrient uptake outer membrane protein [Bacteroidales bacterium]
MKKIIYIILAVVSAASCGKFLNVEKIGKATIDSFFSEIGGVTAAGEGLHKDILTFYGGSSGNLVTYAETAGITLNINTVDADDGEKLAFNYALRPEHTATYPRTIFKNGYTIITSANTLIYYADKFRNETSKDSEKAQCTLALGYGYFARALAHFQLCNCYAQPYNYTPDASHIGVPVVPRRLGFDDVVPRAKVSEVYSLVLSDLHKALEYFGNEDKVNDCTHISGIACEALLARVYLYMGDWENAEKYAKIVMDKVPLSPRSNYVAMFRNPRKNLGAESIFRLDLFGNTTAMLGNFDPTRSHDYYPDPSMASIYDPDDVRKELLTYIAEDCEAEEFKGKSFPAVCKHLPLKSIADPDDKHPYMFVLRASEMYLIHAEALTCGKDHNLAGAAEDIKKLQARARGVDESAITLTWNSQEDMEKIIEKERLRELCYEGHNHFDFLRRNKVMTRFNTTNSTVKEVKYPDYRSILPIEEMEMRANEAMIQNEGY